MPKQTKQETVDSKGNLCFFPLKVSFTIIVIEDGFIYTAELQQVGNSVSGSKLRMCFDFRLC